MDAYIDKARAIVLGASEKYYNGETDIVETRLSPNEADVIASGDGAAAGLSGRFISKMPDGSWTAVAADGEHARAATFSDKEIAIAWLEGPTREEEALRALDLMAAGARA